MTLQERYNKIAVPEMMKLFGYKSRMAVPRLDKVVVNSGFGKAVATKGSGERETIEKYISDNLAVITGQKPALRQAKKSIANFKLREGINVGAVATLRGQRMNDFLEKLIDLVLPRKRDFRGLSTASISRTGELSLGFREHILFPEVKIEKEKGIFGLQVVIATTAHTKDEALELFRLLGFPFER
ncbi:50S ribosomal protein L5 [bacterium (Candidatus Gribaldobacteria) CG_4_10_14_0_2_um_filter_41_16]|uniref:Large ribosomal subunit protein uL5 n=4 Tax=Candidatus Gribaldobacteria TaxID=2798536 RepID=A0A2M7VIH1_9BACT|nr:MAG: 50S ribosomal protein L5 [Parcubacteria group bacterium CG1_02_41_26]PIR91831.1 MAG: 50S ribosomal protein L5 [bacterium (Candidatus Gribaldobacteria) CG10_big_fil_rev_8_21_14_0_10_41_12]PIV46972.1 MAG: 50S ribosomal protein L5 [bacterium (Candidatus Gribaldobacteria) CG02_land_8_20_14_3_00_41_15]PIX03425.1 MAG: 50S ribosomal protein L5 [bacterium (Candidatus Gribaldobacteria) CG_4_8_14_3_um_filter_42_11]PJA01628.1 MAG: 50S ribosomal protein L5 [bacterium (Candidatus Gribaldobacteria) C